MLLKKIELENIKTHKKTVIPFKKGLNVFHGNNGTGKSTVLEMIGFTLFDYLEGRSHDVYVRDINNDKQVFGTIKLWIIGLNNEPYIIERNIGKSEIAVYNALTNRKIVKIEKISQLKKWIETQIGLSKGIELDKLFKTSIGIPQGTFIDPFQREPRERKNYFDPILSLKIYEVIWSELGKLGKGAYERLLHEIKEEISEITGEIKNKSVLINNIDKVTKDFDALEIKVGKIKEVGKKIKEKFDELKNLKEESKSVQEDYEKLQLREKDAQIRVSEFIIKLNQVKEAKLICDKAKNNYEQYELQTKEQKKLEAELSDLQEKQKILQDLKTDHLHIESEKNNLINQINEAKEALENSIKLKSKYNRYQELEADLLLINEDLTRFKTIDEGLTKKRSDSETFKKQLELSHKKIESFSKLETKLKELETLELKKEGIKLIISDLEKEIALINQNYEYLLTGKCPFFNQTCRNIEEKKSDPKSLLKQVKYKKDLLKKSIDEVKQLEKDLEAKEEFHIKIESLKEVRIRLAINQKRFEELNEEIKKENEYIKNKDTYWERKKKLDDEKRALENSINDYITFSKLSEKLPELEKRMNPLMSKLEEIEKVMRDMEKETKKLDQIPKLFKKIQEELANLKKDYTLYQTHIKQAEELPKIEQDYNSSLSALENLKLQIQENQKLIKDLNSKYDEAEFQKYEEYYRKNEKTKTELETRMNERKLRLNELNEELKKIEEIETNLVKLNKEKDNLEVQQLFIEKLRMWIREFIPKMRSALISKINIIASEIYRDIREEEDAVLKWRDNYDIEIVTPKTVKNFFRLSGGEKMSAALAVRLAILKVLTNANFAFFDEPTTNLDETTRKNLSKYIYNIKGFEQLFVISHDDSFKRHSEYVVRFTKDANEITHIDYLTKVNEE